MSSLPRRVQARYKRVHACRQHGSPGLEFRNTRRALSEQMSPALFSTHKGERRLSLPMARGPWPCSGRPCRSQRPESDGHELLSLPEPRATATAAHGAEQARSPARPLKHRQGWRARPSGAGSSRRGLPVRPACQRLHRLVCRPEEPAAGLARAGRVLPPPRGSSGRKRAP